MEIPINNLPKLYYSTTWHQDEFYKAARLGDISEITFSIPAVSDELMREMFGINTNTKETKKMKAKKCDRCGKLYENPVNGENCGAEVRFRYLPVDGEENLSEKKIIEKQTKNIYINSLSVDVDICPQCRKEFKEWFENPIPESTKRYYEHNKEN